MKRNGMICFLIASILTTLISATSLAEYCTCKEGYVGNTFCGDDYNTIYRQYKVCPNGENTCPVIIENRVIEYCSKEQYVGHMKDGLVTFVVLKVVKERL